MNKKTYKGISLFTGAGGMDIGFKSAGVNVVWANEIDKDAYNTYKENNLDTTIVHGDIREKIELLNNIKDIDIIFGGPPCQGFSVAGKMNPDDERSTLVWTFLEAVKIVKPRAFVIENVKALATLKKWEPIRQKIIEIASEMGYSCKPYVLNSVDFGIPQKRERVFFIGFKEKNIDLNDIINNQKKKKKSVREAIGHLGPAGSKNNPKTCTAVITLAKNPVLRKSPYAGMIFNGIGRPLNLEDASTTLPASMGGNKTPIIDENLLYGDKKNDWVVKYHKALIDKTIEPEYKEAPEILRRLTIKEAALIQTFPEEYKFLGSKTSIYRQIGNAVPCELAEVVAKAVLFALNNKCNEVNSI
ncbi:DNA cytosine methyltransferase [Clostridium perfringens]|uniref:DNA cytosine methyltransferase n=1 Tax=Clostridium perfringens TaxID=1502 RepID=UPI003219E383